MEKLSFVVPEGQRYRCLQCGNSCRWWRIEVQPTERDRILSHDWSRESPRLRRLALQMRSVVSPEFLFQEQRLPGRREPVIQMAQVDGQCVFLEEDNLCLIHRVLGMEAKPAVCQAFPLMLIRTVDGMLVAGNYACTAMVRNEGEPFSEQEGLARHLLERAALPAAGGAGILPTSGGGEGRASDSGASLVPPEPPLIGATRLAWQAYQALEASMLEILGRREVPVVQRLVALGSLVSSACVRWAGKGRVEAAEVSAWLEGLKGDGYARAFARAANLPKVPPMRQRAVLAPLIADVETAAGPSTGRTSAAFSYAVSIVNGSGRIPLSTLRGQVDLAAARRVAYDQDSPRFDGYLTRFLTNFTLRKSLLESPTLREGYRCLALYFALVRWYAAASAAMSGRSEVQEEDVVEGIKVVEKAYVHRMGLRSGFRKGLLSALLRFEMDFLVTPAALVRSHQPYS